MRSLLSSLLLVAALVLTAAASGHFGLACRRLGGGVSAPEVPGTVAGAGGPEAVTSAADVYASTASMAAGVLSFLLVMTGFLVRGDRSVVRLLQEEHSEDAFRGLLRLLICTVAGVAAGSVTGMLWPG